LHGLQHLCMHDEHLLQRSWGWQVALVVVIVGVGVGVGVGVDITVPCVCHLMRRGVHEI
jgi:hypothetical protein